MLAKVNIVAYQMRPTRARRVIYTRPVCTHPSCPSHTPPACLRCLPLQRKQKGQGRSFWQCCRIPNPRRNSLCTNVCVLSSHPVFSTSPSECAFIAFNISALIVDELNILVVPSAQAIGMPSAPFLVLAPKLGVSSSTTTEQGALGRQNGLWIFQSLRSDITIC
jgi:hypothetical protein